MLPNKEVIKIIGKNIRYERRKRNLTIEQLSELIDMNSGFLGMCERGARGMHICKLIKITKIFNITLDNLILFDIANENRVDINPVCEERNGLIISIDSYTTSMTNDELKFMVSILKNLAKLKTNDGIPYRLKS